MTRFVIPGVPDAEEGILEVPDAEEGVPKVPERSLHISQNIRKIE